ncbi:MAG: aminopeptidase [Anaerolineales bacterium]
MSIDPKLRQGARNAVRTCMNTAAADRVFITTDDATLLIGEALADEVVDAGGTVKMVRLEEFGQRPLIDVPQGLVEQSIAFRPTITFFAAGSQPGEVQMRMALAIVLREAFSEAGIPQPRSAHMIGITPQIMATGMLTDYSRVYEITMAVFERVRLAKSIHVTSAKGSDLTATFDPELRWNPMHGRLHQPGNWGNLPEGEVFTCPATAEGLVVADVLGDYFSSKYGVLNNPITFEIHDGWVDKVTCQDPSVAEEVWKYLSSNDNGRRVGEFAIGTNLGVKELIGNMLQDEKIPGVHVAFGNPIGFMTGARWTASTHVDVVPTHCTIEVDGEVLMKDGDFIL